MYEVYGRYSSAQHRDEFLDEFTNRKDAEEYVADFEKVSGRHAYIETVI